mgnify:CR=1 FL=1|jgi:hypothetical protein
MDIQFFILLAIIVLPLFFMRSKTDSMKKKSIIIYASVVILSLTYMLIDYFTNDTSNSRFIFVLLLVGAVNLYRLYTKKLI